MISLISSILLAVLVGTVINNLPRHDGPDIITYCKHNPYDTMNAHMCVSLLPISNNLPIMYPHVTVEVVMNNGSLTTIGHGVYGISSPDKGRVLLYCFDMQPLSCNKVTTTIKSTYLYNLFQNNCFTFAMKLLY
jgi:hypothetical protein